MQSNYFQTIFKSRTKLAYLTLQGFRFFRGLCEPGLNVGEHDSRRPHVTTKHATRRWKFAPLYRSLDTGYMALKKKGNTFLCDHGTRFQLA